jgi:hypothetical protein
MCGHWILVTLVQQGRVADIVHGMVFEIEEHQLPNHNFIREKLSSGATHTYTSQISKRNPSKNIAKIHRHNCVGNYVVVHRETACGDGP